MLRTRFLLVALAVVMAGGCGVKKATHQRALDALAACQGELSGTKNMLDTQKKKVAQLEGELDATRSERDAKGQAAVEKEKRIKDLLASMGDAEQELLKLRKQREQDEKRLTAYRALNDRLRQLIDTGKLDVAFRNGQMILKLPSGVLFPSGKGELSKNGKAALSEVLNILLEFKDRRFQIAGHTDNVPIRSHRFHDNWQLSTARAVSVVEAMVDAGFDPKNLSASGYCEFDPVAPNDTSKGRALNRRIEIILVPDLSELPNLTKNPS